MYLGIKYLPIIATILKKTQNATGKERPLPNRNPAPLTIVAIYIQNFRLEFTVSQILF